MVINLDGKAINNATEIAEIFSKKFDNGKNYGVININNVMAMLAQNTQKVKETLVLSPTNSQEIFNIVKHMENKISSGYDDIPIKIIKDNIDLLSEPLAYFYNKCISQGIFPEKLKIAKIVPIHKKNSKIDPNNYRPIALLPVLSKIMEKLIKVRLISHLNRNKVLNERQFGYQKGVGTIDAVDTIVNDILTELNKKVKVAGLFLDLSSAFDTVDYSILIKKLEYYGIRDQSLKLIKSYLSNRRQFVEIIDTNELGVQIKHRSVVTTVTRGVPQGSVLGPIFFIIFLNDLIDYICNLIPEIRVIIFADDTSAVLSSKTAEELKNKIIVAMTTFQKWFTANGLLLNTTKTNIIMFKATARNNDITEVCVSGEVIKTVNSVKFLGIHLDDLLNWKVELATIADTISSATYALRTLREELTVDQLLNVYYALVESKLRYSIKFWGNSYKYNMNKAFTAQKSAVRAMVCIPPWESCKAYFKKLNVLTAPSLYILILLTDVFKNRHFYESLEEMKERECTRRMDLTLPIMPKMEIVKHCPRYQAVLLFNKMPKKLKEIKNLSAFKSELKALLIDKCIYNIDEF